MKRISHKEVELNIEEQFARVFYEDCLDNGHTIANALDLTRSANTMFGALSDDFYRWLADDEIIEATTNP